MPIHLWIVSAYIKHVSWIAATETIWLTKPKILIIKPFTENCVNMEQSSLRRKPPLPLFNILRCLLQSLLKLSELCRKTYNVIDTQNVFAINVHLVWLYNSGYIQRLKHSDTAMTPWWRWKESSPPKWSQLQLSSTVTSTSNYEKKDNYFEGTEHWRFEDNCDEMILPRKLVTVHDFYCVPVSTKIGLSSPLKHGYTS